MPQPRGKTIPRQGHAIDSVKLAKVIRKARFARRRRRRRRRLQVIYLQRFISLDPIQSPSDPLIAISLIKMTIPVATEVRESAVISASVDDLWNLIQLPNVASFWTNLQEVQSSANVTKWTFHDGTVLDVKQEEHSVRQIISFTRSAVRWRSISDQSLNSRLLFPPILQPPGRQIACGHSLTPLPKEHRPLHHLLGHQRPAAAQLLERRLHDPAVPHHVRRQRRQHICGLVRQLLQRRGCRYAAPRPRINAERMRPLIAI
jgi:hypothetical protein